MIVNWRMFLCGLLITPAAVDAFGDEPRRRSSAPVTYVLDYGKDHVANPDFLAQMQECSPTLLHLGKDVVFTHNWGPIQALGGENQAYGKGEYITRLTPAQVRQRIADLKELVTSLHTAGAKIVVPYICGMTIGGDENTRKGFWEFYDHWNEYAEFDLGKRPPLDPIDWMQRTSDGTLQRFYKYTGPFYPPYEPNQRDAACVNNPCWQHWLGKVAEWVAKVGYDGAFVDNAGSQRCYCSICQREFREYILTEYGEENATRLFGEKRTLAASKDEGLRWVETRRFWLESIRRHLARIRAAGEKFVAKFYVFPNGGERRPESVKLAFPDADFVMFERSYGQFGTHPGMALFNVVEDIHLKKYNDNVFEHKYVQCLHRNVKPIMLTRAGYPRSEDHLRMNPNVAALGMAEAAAFGNGGGFLVRTKENCRLVQEQFRQFFDSNAFLYAGTDCYAHVAIAVFSEQNLYGNTRHILSVKQATQQLLDGHVPFDYVIEEDFTPVYLKKYRAVVLPHIEYMADKQIASLTEFVKTGGVALIAGECGGFDERCVQRRRVPFSDLQRSEVGGVQRTELGDGTIGIVETLGTGDTWLADCVERLCGRTLRVLSCETPALRKVRVNIFARDSEKEYIIHVVNYNVPLGIDAEPVVEFQNLRFNVELDGLPGQISVEYLGPNIGAPVPLKFERREPEIGFTLPQVRIYTIVRMKGG